jgi:DNA sulfur modification protein DndD
LTQDRERLLRQQVKGARILSELEVTKDIIDVLENSYTRITNDELTKVSELMNALFLEMIGADPKQGAIIREAQITREFDIIVLGPEGRTLNPDRDLNGASRRALTLAFILALTKVSEVEAPNVIDTPLGMTSGSVRQWILRTVIRESSQPILFLTHDEILGCEEIIDEYVGRIFTLTNPMHYPKMLVNVPSSTEQKVIRCECNHRQQCRVCERLANVAAILEMAS